MFLYRFRLLASRDQSLFYHSVLYRICNPVGRCLIDFRPASLPRLLQAGESGTIGSIELRWKIHFNLFSQQLQAGAL
jgi:hypothetical protein